MSKIHINNSRVPMQVHKKLYKELISIGVVREGGGEAKHTNKTSLFSSICLLFHSNWLFGFTEKLRSLLVCKFMQMQG